MQLVGLVFGRLMHAFWPAASAQGNPFLATQLTALFGHQEIRSQLAQATTPLQ